MVKQLVRTSVIFSEKKIGALIAIEREDSLRTYSDSGMQIDALVSEELLESIFIHHSPLHDGGVIIVGGRITSAGCLFPLTDSSNIRLSRSYGTRHRAALGLAEDTDAVVIAVSEETGKISLAMEGHIISDISKEELSRTLRNLLRRKS